jgi:hypothetical protein
MKQIPTAPETFIGVGYARDHAGLPLEAVRVPVPRPAADQVVIHVASSSLNPLEYKLAELNFLGRKPPVALGFDLAGVVVDAGPDVTRVAVGDAVAAMADLNGDGGWAATGGGAYTVARQFLTARKPPSLSFRDAAALPHVLPLRFRGSLRGRPGRCRRRPARWMPSWPSAEPSRSTSTCCVTSPNPPRWTAPRVAFSSGEWTWRWSGRRGDSWSRGDRGPRPCHRRGPSPGAFRVT